MYRVAWNTGVVTTRPDYAFGGGRNAGKTARMRRGVPDVALPNKTYTEMVTATFGATRGELLGRTMEANPLLQRLFGTGGKGDVSMMSDEEIRRISDRIFDKARGRVNGGMKAPPPRERTYNWSDAQRVVFDPTAASAENDPRATVVIDGKAIPRKDVVTFLDVAKGSYVPSDYVQAFGQDVWYKPPVAEPVVQPEPETLWPPKRELDL